MEEGQERGTVPAAEAVATASQLPSPPLSEVAAGSVWGWYAACTFWGCRNAGRPCEAAAPGLTAGADPFTGTAMPKPSEISPPLPPAQVDQGHGALAIHSASGADSSMHTSRIRSQEPRAAWARHAAGWTSLSNSSPTTNSSEPATLSRLRLTPHEVLQAALILRLSGSRAAPRTSATCLWSCTGWGCRGRATRLQQGHSTEQACENTTEGIWPVVFKIPH